MSLIPQILAPVRLSPEQRDAMFVLMDRHYANLCRRQFESDLEAKDWVLLLTAEEGGAIRGFSTQVLDSITVAGRTIRYVFSGDTIVDRDAWGSSALSTAFGKLACHWIDQYPEDELYWYLICKGFRTYRAPLIYFRECYPRYDATTPADLRRILDAIGQQRFPDRYDARRGVILASADSDYLRPGVGDITPERERDPHVRYFLEQNPGHARGDELGCIARLAVDNFSAVAQRVVNSAAFARLQIG